jgi:isocitrate/isopropylmalate dehydrogenase
MAARSYRVACLAGCGTAPELMAEASRALQAVARLHGLRIEQVHIPFGADAVVRGGNAVPHAARAAYLSCDAVLAVDEDESTIDGLRAELDLRARQTRVRFGSGSDMVLLAPLSPESSAWTAQRAFALARQRRAQISVVSDGTEWQSVVEHEAGRNEGVRLEPVARGAALAAAAFDPESMDVLLADATLGELMASLVGAAAVPARVAATGFLAEHGPALFVPDDTGVADHAGFGATDPSSMLLAAAMLLGDGLGERSAADTLVGALAGEEHRSGRSVASTTRELTDAVLARFQISFPNAEFHPGVLAR